MTALRRASPGDERAAEAILRALPDWFGIEESLLMYARDSAAMETWFALSHHDAPALDALGFITLNTHSPAAAEIHCIAVRPEHHRAGIGRGLVEHAERLLKPRGVKLLQVKTLGPTRRSEHYGQTRLFYEGMGFLALEEHLTLWPGMPCLQMVKVIA